MKTYRVHEPQLGADLLAALRRSADESSLRAAAYDAAVEIERLRKIETAAIEWRKSLEGDGWTEADILCGICRPGVAEIMRELQAADASRIHADTAKGTENP